MNKKIVNLVVFIFFFQFLLVISNVHVLGNKNYEPGPEVTKLFFMLNSVEHEILNAHKYKNIKKFGLSKAQFSLECYFPRSYMLKCQRLLTF